MVAERKFRFGIVALILLFVALRLWGLTDSCLWFDEIFSVHAAEHSWSTIFTFVAQDIIHPPLFYLLLKIWISIGGESVFWLRLLPVLISTIALVPFLLLCKQFELRSRAILLALFLLAVNGSAIKYSQEVRMYSLLMCLTLFSFWSFVRSSKQGKGSVLLLAVNILLVYSHYFGWFVVFAEIAYSVFLDRATIKRILLVAAGSFAIFLPWLIFVLKLSPVSSGLNENIGWMQRPGLGDISAFLLSTVEPLYAARVSTDAASDYRVSVPLLIIFALVVAIFFARKRNSEERETGSRYLLFFIVIPLTAVFILSWVLPYSIWGIRHLIFVVPPWLILLAFAIDNFPVGSLRIAGVTLIFLFTGYATVIRFQRPEIQYSWCEWEMLEKRIELASFTQPVKIYAFEDLIAYHLWFNIRESANSYRIDKIIGVNGVAEDNAYFLARGFDGVKKVSIDEIPDEKFWIALIAEDCNVTKPPLNEFILRGYRLGGPITSHAAEGDLFLVPVEK